MDDNIAGALSGFYPVTQSADGVDVGPIVDLISDLSQRHIAHH